MNPKSPFIENMIMQQEAGQVGKIAVTPMVLAQHRRGLGDQWPQGQVHTPGPVMEAENVNVRGPTGGSLKSVTQTLLYPRGGCGGPK